MGEPQAPRSRGSQTRPVVAQSKMLPRSWKWQLSRDGEWPPGAQRGWSGWSQCCSLMGAPFIEPCGTPVPASEKQSATRATRAARVPAPSGPAVQWDRRTRLLGRMHLSCLGSDALPAAGPLPTHFPSRDPHQWSLISTRVAACWDYGSPSVSAGDWLQPPRTPKSKEAEVPHIHGVGFAGSLHTPSRLRQIPSNPAMTPPAA